MKLGKLAIPTGLALLVGGGFSSLPASAAGSGIGCIQPGILTGPACDSTTAHDSTFQDTDTQDNANTANAVKGTSQYEITKWSVTPTVGDPNCNLAGVVCPANAHTDHYLVMKVSTAGSGVAFGSNITTGSGTNVQPKQGVGWKTWSAHFEFQNPNIQDKPQETSPGGLGNGDFIPAYISGDGAGLGLNYQWNPGSGTSPHSQWGFELFTPELFYGDLNCNLGDAINGAGEPADTGTITGYDQSTGVGCGSINYDGSTLTAAFPYNYHFLGGNTNVGTANITETMKFGNPGDPINGAGFQTWGERDAFASANVCVTANNCPLQNNNLAGPVPGFLTVVNQSPSYGDSGFNKAMAYGTYRRIGGGYPNPTNGDCRAWLLNYYVISNYGYVGGTGNVPYQAQSGTACYIKNNFGRHYYFDNFGSTF